MSGRTGARDGLHRDRSPTDAVVSLTFCSPGLSLSDRLSSYPDPPLTVSLSDRLSSYTDPSRGAPERGPMLLSDPAPGVLDQGAASCQRPAATSRVGGRGTAGAASR